MPGCKKFYMLLLRIETSEFFGRPQGLRCSPQLHPCGVASSKCGSFFFSDLVFKHLINRVFGVTFSPCFQDVVMAKGLDWDSVMEVPKVFLRLSKTVNHTIISCMSS